MKEVEIKPVLDGIDTVENFFDHVGYPLSVLEGCNLLYIKAEFDPYSYDSDAMVLFEKEGLLYRVRMARCSRHDWEDEWNPEIVSIEELKKKGKIPEVIDKVEAFLCSTKAIKDGEL